MLGAAIGEVMPMKCKTARVILMAAGLIMLTYGVWRGEAEIVFNKAIRLCLECVGIG